MLNDEESRLQLPPVPAELAGEAVAVWSQPLTIDTYLPLQPSPYPAFLDTRVYQGSSGRVFPLPFHERIDHEKRPHEWQAVHLENEYLRLVILPELGGRLHIGYDKVADYDFFYRNNVVKPALVGLAGPWISGGVEFNWPQHHRPGTFLPTDWHIEREPDGAVTVWCSDHDPLQRMKGMHGIRVRPRSSLIEARVRLYNRTDDTQTFLWWANVAAAVGDDYQSFFPRDVHHVADHAKRAVATFPRVDGLYYGVDYASRVDAAHPDADRLDWYRNIPVPTSYMVTSTADDFFGGYDHAQDAGFVHWADRSVAPGKKQWTWGNAPFGWAWDANLTDTDGPYVELMAGVYTDNQPDFSWITPGETKTFSQFWYPIQAIGPAHQASREAAVSLTVESSGVVRVGVAVSSVVPLATLVLRSGERELRRQELALTPTSPLVQVIDVADADPSTLVFTVSAGGRTLVEWRPVAETATSEPDVATEPRAPHLIETADELFYTGQYLAQYRHATRHPEPYWREALRRDPGDVRCNIALAERELRAGRLAQAEEHLRAALGRESRHVPNPADGAAHYLLGLVLSRRGRADDAEAAWRKAHWNSAWRVASGFAIARSRGRAGDLEGAELAARGVLAVDAEHTQAADLLALVLRTTGRADEADAVLAGVLRRDPLDQWARHLAGEPLTDDAPTLLDVALEYATAGFADAALEVLELAADASARTALGQVQVAPLVHYHRAAILDALGRPAEAAAARADARAADARTTLPSRLDDVAALEAAVAADADDARASLLLGSWYYDRGRADEAIAAWSRATADTDAVSAAIAHRNLGIALYNVHHDSDAALDHYRAARRLAQGDAQLLVELDQLLERTGESSADRLERLEAEVALVGSRDDLSARYARLLTSVGRAADARAVLLGRRFQPWEGGEGQILGAWDEAMRQLAASSADPRQAVAHLEAALAPPASLGEARHPLANAADLWLALGDARAAADDPAGAEQAWQVAASFSGDFVGMSTEPFSAQTIHSVRALLALGRTAEARDVLDGLAAHVEHLATTPAAVDFFATSLPSMLLFHDDPQRERDALVALLRSQISALGEPSDDSPAAVTRHEQRR